MNYQPVTFHNGTYTYDYVAVGGWDQGNITIYTEKVFFPGQQFGSGPSTVKSVCSEPCPSGQVKVCVVFSLVTVRDQKGLINYICFSIKFC